jgi:hypothetical protein
VGALVRGYDTCAARKRAAAGGARAPEFVVDAGADADALIYRIGANLTGRYEHGAR